MTNWYLGAGCIAQTVWNFFHDFEPTIGIGIADYDLVYHDASDLSLEAQGATWSEQTNSLPTCMPR